MRQYGGSFITRPRSRGAVQAGHGRGLRQKTTISEAPMMAVRAVCAAVALLVPAHRLAAQAGAAPRADSVRGRVTSDSGAVIAGADVIITIAPSTKTVRQT